MDKKKYLILAISIGVIALITAVVVIMSNKLEYKVDFNSDGGSKISSQMIKKNDKVKEPSSPIKDGYIFVEWKLNDKKYNFSTPVSNSFILNAVWKKIENGDILYKVDFDVDGVITSKTVLNGEKIIKITDPTKENYKFKGWYLNGIEYNFDSVVASDITLKAEWEAIKVEENNKKPSTNNNVIPSVTKYTVTYNSNGGTAIASQTVEKGNTANKPQDPTKPGYTFVNWMLGGNVYDFISKITSNIVLEANWKIIITQPGVPTISLGDIGRGGTPMGSGYSINVTGVDGAEGYEIYKSTNSGQYTMFKQLDATPIGSGVSLLDFDFVYLGDTNSYKARAYKKDGTNFVYGDFSSVKSESAPALSNPVLEIRGAGGSGETKSILLGMSTSDDVVEHFEIYRSTSIDSGYTLLGTVNETDSVWEMSVDIPVGMTYHYKVRGYVTDGVKTIYSGYSNIISESFII